MFPALPRLVLQKGLIIVGCYATNLVSQPD